MPLSTGPEIVVRNRHMLILDAILDGRITSMEQIAPMFGISSATAQDNLKHAIRASCWQCIPGDATTWICESAYSKNGRAEALQYLATHRDEIRQAREALLLAKHEEAERTKVAWAKLAPLTIEDIEAIEIACRPAVHRGGRQAIKAFGPWADFNPESAPQTLLSILPLIHVKQIGGLKGSTLTRLRTWLHKHGRCLVGDEKWDPTLRERSQARKAVSILERMGYTISKPSGRE